MRFQDAMDLVPDDLPDGAFWAMAHEMAGLEYGEGFAELSDEPEPSRKQKAERARPLKPHKAQISHALKSRNPDQAHKPWVCQTCKKRFRLEQAARDHWYGVHAEPTP